MKTKVMYYPQSKFRTTAFTISALGFAIDKTFWAYCLQHKTWDRHGLSTNARMAEPDGTYFRIDESEPGTITGRSPHHRHEGEFWIECCGYASLQTRDVIASRKSPPDADRLLVKSQPSANQKKEGK